MSSGNISEPIKSCIWVGFKVFNVDLEIITAPPIKASVRDSITFGFLDDKFELFVVKALESTVSVAVYRTRQNSTERPDDGYDLRFHFAIIGFDEEPQTAIMRHARDRSNPPATFEINESVLAKVNTHHSFELFVVVQMLEFGNLHSSHERKKDIDDFMSAFGIQLSSEELEDLRCILKTQDIRNAFTGRLPSTSLTGIKFIILKMAKNFNRIAEYFRTRENRDSKDRYLYLSSILKYFGLPTDEGILPPEEATEQYLIAHMLGLDCYKIMTSDYLVSILDQDYNVLDVLEVSVLVQDEDLFKRAADSFLRRFHEIVRSAKFQYFVRSKRMNTRLLIHSVFVWMINNNIHIPGCSSATELIF